MLQFLDRVCTKIVETEQGVAYSYNGNYRTFIDQKMAKEAADGNNTDEGGPQGEII